jgi:CheY-like chemotaxis protein
MQVGPHRAVKDDDALSNQIEEWQSLVQTLFLLTGTSIAIIGDAAKNEKLPENQWLQVLRSMNTIPALRILGGPPLMARLLLVDDNIEATRPLAMLFRFFSYNVDYVSSGDQALRYLENSLPDLMLLDVMMPGMDGMEVLRRIRNDPRLRHLPVIMFSAVSDPSYREAALSKGANDYLIKGSVEIEELRRRVEQAATTGGVSPGMDDCSSTNPSHPHYHH